MNIQPVDRDLARELADLFDLSETDERMLAIILWSHREVGVQKALADLPTKHSLRAMNGGTIAQ